MRLKILFLFIFALSLTGCATSNPYKNESSALYDKALRQYNVGRYEEAKEYFHEYIANFPESNLYPVALYYLGHCYQQLEDYKQALLIYHKVISQADEGDFWAESARWRVQQIKELESH